MKEEVITFETAVLAKEKGFEENCFSQYVNNGKLMAEDNFSGPCIQAPSQSLLQRWLREVQGINIVIVPSFRCYQIQEISVFDIDDDSNSSFELHGLEFKDFDTYEQALEAGLQTALNLIEL